MSVLYTLILDPICVTNMIDAITIIAGSITIHSVVTTIGGEEVFKDPAGVRLVTINKLICLPTSVPTNNPHPITKKCSTRLMIAISSLLIPNAFNSAVVEAEFCDKKSK